MKEVEGERQRHDEVVAASFGHQAAKEPKARENCLESGVARRKRPCEKVTRVCDKSIRVCACRVCHPKW
eukprot:scaffold102_cov27-Tisochrysis_lutea.AAC.3